MYLMFKIKNFKMQLIENYTANPVHSTWSASIVSSFFRKNCPIRGAFLKKINLKKIFMLIGRREESLNLTKAGIRPSKMRFKYNKDLSVFSQSHQKSSWSILIGSNVKNAPGRLMETLLTSCFHSIWCFEQFYLSFWNFIWNQFKCKSEPRISLANRHRTDCSLHSHSESHLTNLTQGSER